MKRRLHPGYLVVLATVLLTRLAAAAEWQWSVDVPGPKSDENGRQPTAFLWVPPNCQHVRAVVIGQHNMEEEPILEHPAFRRAMGELGVAEVWLSPALDPFFRFDKGAAERFDVMMKALAEESGYSELEKCPVIPIGHSAMASYPWNFAAWAPNRTLAAISVSGQWPYYTDTNTPPWNGKTVDGVPGLVSMGEYEWAEDRAAEGLKERAEHAHTALTFLANPASGHFDWTDAKVDYLALYLRKAMQYRLPADASPSTDGSVDLKPIDPTKEGWLVDRWHKAAPPKAPAAPVGQYTGDAKDAFWCFDEELAKATENFGAECRGKKVDLLGYIQNGQVVPQNPSQHAQVTLKFLPEGDGLTFKLTPTFIDTVPDGRPTKWTGLPAGAHVDHALGGPPPRIERICGPVAKLSGDTFAIRFYRMGIDNKKRSNEIYLMAIHDGDDQYQRTVQQSVMHFPLHNDKGADQHITFPEISDQPIDTRSLKLNATSDAAGATVHYYVLAGPAEVSDDGTLTFTQIPPRAKLPIKVTVVAWQWGRSIEPKLKTAEPVERSFVLK
jgi:hypothetical protein